MRKIWTSGFHIHQKNDNQAQLVRIAIEHLGSEIPDIQGDHDIWLHSSEFENLEKENAMLKAALVNLAEYCGNFKIVANENTLTGPEKVAIGMFGLIIDQCTDIVKNTEKWVVLHEDYLKKKDEVKG